ncbi:MAG: DUF4443 domain-containing protein [Candidatus Thorarchaeota archaeon]
MLDELEELFESETIKPTYDYVHVILALFIFEENPNGIGRYRLKEELLIGSGTAKSLIKKLNEKLNFISVLNGNIRKGHILTENGLNFFLNKVKKKIPFLKKGDISILKDIIIESEDVRVYFCQIKNVGDKLTKGIEQRDAAIKVGGIGATCLVYDGKNIIYPVNISDTEKTKMTINKQPYKYFNEEIIKSDSKLEKNDVIIIGLGNKLERARIAALNAALTLI